MSLCFLSAKEIIEKTKKGEVSSVDVAPYTALKNLKIKPNIKLSLIKNSF